MEKLVATEELPDYLAGIYQIIVKAFPDGIKAEDYFPLIAALYEDFSNRNLAKLLAYCTGKDWGIIYNDILGIESAHKPKPEAVKKIKQRLISFGYEEGLKQIS